MLWVIQNNLFSEEAITSLVSVIKRNKLNHRLVKVIPFGGGITPKIRVKNQKVVTIGSYSLSKYALDKGWLPGSWMDDNTFDQMVQMEIFKDHMLNYDVTVSTIRNFEPKKPSFIRPVKDGKEFAGHVVNPGAFRKWRDSLLQADDSWTINLDTEIVASTPKVIYKEARFIVVDNKLITQSLYKQGSRVLYSPTVDQELIDFANDMIKVWTPAPVCVIDIALTKDGPKVIEFNNFNSAGWYHCDVAKIVEAIENFVEK